jgi:hypothetical protein
MKYYIPTIDELHVGFEYQFKIEDGLWQVEEFVLNKHDVSYSELGSINKHIGNNKVRIKFLDQKDIKSLGFTKTKSDVDEITYQMLFDNTEDFVELIYSTISTTLVIEKFVEQSEDRYNSHILFQGCIKNKSELIKLLKQLNILSDENI